jgi:hypothetical protein
MTMNSTSVSEIVTAVRPSRDRGVSFKLASPQA